MYKLQENYWNCPKCCVWMIIWESIICLVYLVLTVNFAKYVWFTVLFSSNLTVVMCIYIFILLFSSNYLNSSWVELNASRGHESYDHKVFMRNTGKLLIVSSVILCLLSLSWLLQVLKMLYIMGRTYSFLHFSAVRFCSGLMNFVNASFLADLMEPSCHLHSDVL